MRSLMKPINLKPTSIGERLHFNLEISYGSILGRIDSYPRGITSLCHELMVFLRYLNILMIMLIRLIRKVIMECQTFNVADLQAYHEDDYLADLRIKSSPKGEDDVVPTTIDNEEDPTSQSRSNTSSKLQALVQTVQESKGLSLIHI